MTNYEYLKIVDDELETIKTSIGKIKISRGINSILATTFTLSTLGSNFIVLNNSKIETLHFITLSYLLMVFYYMRILDCNKELQLLNENSKKLTLSREKVTNN